MRAGAPASPSIQATSSARGPSPKGGAGIAQIRRVSSRTCATASSDGMRPRRSGGPRQLRLLRGEHGVLGRGTEDHLAAQHRAGARVDRRPDGGLELGVGGVARLGDPARPRRRAVERAVLERVEAAGAVDGERGDRVVGPSARGADGRLVERPERGPVLDEVPVLERLRGAAVPRRGVEAHAPGADEARRRCGVQGGVERAEQVDVAAGVDPRTRFVPEEIGEHRRCILSAAVAGAGDARGVAGPAAMVGSMSMPPGEHRDAMVEAIALEGTAHRALLAGDATAARDQLRAAAARYRTSWELAPPRSYGRLIGMLKALVIAGDDAAARDGAAYAREQVAETDASPPAWYALAIAALIDGDDALAMRAAEGMGAAGVEPFLRTAAAVDAIARADGAAYAGALAAIV